MAFLSELDSEVIHNEDEDYWAPGVPPEAGCDYALVVSVFTQSGGEEVVGQFSGLFEAVDAFVDLEVNPVAVRKSGEVIFITKFLRDVGKFDPDIFWLVKRRAEVEVFHVKAGKACIWRGDDTVDE